MAQLSDIIQWCDQTLQSNAFKDYAPNGLQIEGAREVTRIASAVTASQHAIAAAIELEAQLLLVHHGYFWKGEAAPITGMRGQRIKSLIQNDISLVAYHLPLDAHPELGNNRSIADLLQLQHIEALDRNERYPIGNIAYLAEPMSVTAFHQLLQSRFQSEQIQHLAADRQMIQKIGFCTGAAQDFIHQAAQQGCDAYLSGEVSERTYYEAQEMNIHYFACGHHATERFGVQRLGAAIAEQFSIEHQYIELNNPI
ncbi:Nif3-like dinuclear metal center hexameric protein [Acinetobacter larvae]|uniref:GTP cyclohydrolase 1 type 2 homolog n=1 Tax=Acinetobacter larvae TaxID=1789224 RepID=A0A1B2M1E8_9GAMM|nr:Nif3-like dinuclear metal center hexameric protein [Acinetobacter larvae]AOA59026.1 Nif3-like dinuclear metal center hexameric protein [Acinetobacter larvae]